MTRYLIDDFEFLFIPLQVFQIRNFDINQRTIANEIAEVNELLLALVWNG